MGRTGGRPALDVAALEALLTAGVSEEHRVLLNMVRGGAFFGFDRDLRFLFAEGDALRAAGMDPRRDIEGKPFDAVLGHRADHLREAYQHALTGDVVELDLEHEGRVHWVRVSPIVGEAGTPIGGVSISMDVTEQRRTESDVRLRARAQSAIAELGQRALDGASTERLLHEAADAVALTLGVEASSIVRLDEACDSLVLSAGFGWSQEVIRSTRIPITDEHRQMLVELAKGPELLTDVGSRVPDGPLLRAMGIASMATVLIGPADRPYGTLSASSFTPREFGAQDASFLQSVAHVLWSAIDRAHVEDDLRYAAQHDELTGLANRRLFVTRVEQALERARRERGAAAVLLIDVDNFALINESLGHGGGDKLLRAITPRLRGAARDADTVARVGSDAFAIVSAGIVSDDHAWEIARRVMAALGRPIRFSRRRAVVQASIGLVVNAGDCTPDEMLRDADTAMHRAKERGGGCIEQFSPSMHSRAVARMRTEWELRRALQQDELVVHYQPIWSTPDRRILGVEALARWEHPVRGLVPPGEFIPLAEETGQIVQLGAWVLTAAANDLARWRATVPTARSVTLSVNVSARQLKAASSGSDPTLLSTVARVLQETRLPPARLALEITETMLMQTGEDVQSVLLALNALGVQLMLDDFGTGHSSLGRLRDIPLDVVKIDRCFVSGIGSEPGQEPIVAAIIAMARAMNLRVIAEGVESEADLDQLMAHRCDAAQGYALGRPMPADDLAALLAEEAAEQAA
jgi:diguanylate cyclase (GGDEF)-like protein